MKDGPWLNRGIMNHVVDLLHAELVARSGARVGSSNLVDRGALILEHRACRGDL